MFNFCQTVNQASCPKTIAGIDDGSTCTNLAGSSLDNDVNALRDYARTGDDEDGGLLLQYNNGPACAENPTKNQGLIIDLYCDDDDDDIGIPQAFYVGQEQGGCTYRVKVTSHYACYKFTMNPLLKWIHKYSYLFGAVLIIIGFIVGVFGKPLFKPTICIIGTFVFLIISTLFIFSVFFNRDTGDWIGWVVFSVCLVLGSFVGLILAKVSRLGVGIIAGWGGFCLGLILYNSFMYKIDTDS